MLNSPCFLCNPLLWWPACPLGTASPWRCRCAGSDWLAAATVRTSVACLSLWRWERKRRWPQWDWMSSRTTISGSNCGRQSISYILTVVGFKVITGATWYIWARNAWILEGSYSCCSSCTSTRPSPPDCERTSSSRCSGTSSASSRAHTSARGKGRVLMSVLQQSLLIGGMKILLLKLGLQSLVNSKSWIHYIDHQQYNY